MAIDVNSLQTFTDAELLKLYRHALATGAAGTERTINGRTIKIPPVQDLMKVIGWLESRVSDADNASVVIEFAEPK